MTPRVLVTGPSGFVGSAVLRAAASSPHRPLLRLAVHRNPIAGAGVDARHEVVQADLADPTSLYGLCEGVDLVVHCASAVGADQERCAAVNARGTHALAAEVARAGVRRLVYLSTAAVYGPGTFTRARESDLRTAPASAVSRTRVEAERAVRACGGTVLRPHLVYGVGDRWVLPGLVALLRPLGATVDGWPARISMIDVDSLGRLLLATAFSTRSELIGAAYHANHPEPVDCAVLMTQVRSSSGLPPASETIDVPEARARLGRDERAAHALATMSTDHWFESARIWALTDCRPGPGFTQLPAGGSNRD